MIKISEGADVLDLLDQITMKPYRYERVVISSPFIDDDMFSRIALLARATTRSRCKLWLITTPSLADRLTLHFQRSPAPARANIVARARLHAKLYLAVDQQGTHSEAIVTSANLTRAGTGGNIELGVRIASTSLPGRLLLRQLRDFVRRLAA